MRIENKEEFYPMHKIAQGKMLQSQYIIENAGETRKRKNF